MRGSEGCNEMDDKHTQPAPEKARQLSPADAEVLDAILEARAKGLDRGPIPAGSADRADRVRGVLQLLEQYPVEEPAEDLTQRTLARLREVRQRERFAQQVQMLSAPRPTMGVTWQQVIASAAMFLIGFSLLMPVLQRNQEQSRQLGGAANLAAAGVGFGQYAADNRDALPRRHIEPGSVWWNVGKPITREDQAVESNSAHLYLLVRRGYVSPEDLSHPGNADAPREGEMSAKDHDWRNAAAVSFSYQNQYRSQPSTLSKNPDLVILADRNPIFVLRVGQVVQDTTTPLDAPSRMYRGGGQNVLTADGAVTFTVRPVAPRGESAGDLIWGARGVKRYSGTEQPVDENDSFLVP